MNRRDKLLKNHSIDKEKQGSNIRPGCGVSLETSSAKLNIEIVGDSMINRITPVGLSRNCKCEFRTKTLWSSDIWRPRRSYPPNSKKKATCYCNIHCYKWH